MTDNRGTLRFVADAGRVVCAWAAVLLMEHAAIGIGSGEELAGAWEAWPARTAGAPLFLGLGLVGALVCAGLSRLAARKDPRALEALAAIAGVAVGWGVGTGRHFSAPLLRAALAVAVGALGVLAAKAFRRLDGRPAARAAVLGVVAVLAWWVDGHVLVRLYPAFHLGLFGAALVAAGLAAIDARIPGPRTSSLAVVLSAAFLLYVPIAAKRLRQFDNLRRVLVDHAPWMGRAVRVGTLIAPPEATVAPSELHGPGEVARALDWSGLDVVLVSIDALRADHVGAYGYRRPTTPSLDALAREGTLFEHAYCPTPHTSYSVTSMMTGKYMRPLLTLGLGQDSETLAGGLRRYGYRTAAFYPPAVFFIDQPRFTSFEARALDFEYRKVEFADPLLREAQVKAYVAEAPTDKPLFLWVHFFEPHEPYVPHPEHPFGDTDLDVYDSEIAAADDGVGKVVAAVRAARPTAVVIVTADHGEEFGDHGGRYHGTTVYEEQVRVPLVVVGKGVRAQKIDAPVQTIDLVPTVLSALGIPRPPRVRGKDLGPLLAGNAAHDEGFAFAETDDASLLAEGRRRLVCNKQSDSCALYDVGEDPTEKRDLSATRRAEVDAMRAKLFAVERSHGRFEGQGASLPEALRRGAAGDVAAAEEVAALLDDVNPAYRREAARVLFDLKSPKVDAQLARAAHDDDEEVASTSLAALLRTDPTAPLGPVRALLASHTEGVRRRAALALAERGDATGVGELVLWLRAPDVEFLRQREILEALGRVKARAAVAPLVEMLDDVRLRGLVAKALGDIGDPSAKGPLLAHFEAEPYVLVREREGRALLALGASKDLRAPLTRYAGMPEPTPGTLDLATEAGVLRADPPSTDVQTTLRSPSSGPLKLGLLLAEGTPSMTLELDGKTVVPTAGSPVEQWAEVPVHGETVAVHASAPSGGVRALWLVAAAR